MSFSPDFDRNRRGWWGFGAVLGLHVLVAWALMQGAASKVIESVQPAVQVILMAEAPSALPPLPEPNRPKASPALKASPAPKAPAVAPPPAPAVTPAVQAESAQPVPQAAISLPSPPAPISAAQAVVAAGTAPAISAGPTPATSPANHTAPKGIGLVCPQQVPPVMPRRASQEGISGTVTARATVRSGRVVAVEILSAKPRGVFEMAVKRAMLQYQCESNAPGDVLADQLFEFKLEP